MRNTRSLFAVMSMMLLTLVPLFFFGADGDRPLFMANVRVVTDPVEDDFDQIPYDMKTDANGRIYIAYSSNWKYYVDVYLKYSDDNGETWSRQIRVDDTLRDGNESNDKSNQGRPSIAIAANNTVYIAWNDKRDTKMPAEIRMAWSHDGENFTSSLRIDPFRDVPNWDALEPRLAINGEGRFICVWRDKIYDGSYFNIWGSYSTDNGLTWAHPVKINTDPYFSRDHRNMRIAVFHSNVYVTWEDNRGDGTFRPYLAVSKNGGVNYSLERAISDDVELENSRGSPWPAVDGMGNLYIVWRDRRSGRDEIWLTKSTDEGDTLSPNRKITRAPDHNHFDQNPSIVATGDGMLHLAFQRKRPDAGKIDEGDLFFIGSTDGGQTWTDPIRIDDSDRYSPDHTKQADPILALDLYGNAIAAWSDSRDFYKSQIDLYFSRHSGLPGSFNLLPEIRMMSSFSPFTKYPNMTSPDALTTFRFMYLDANNDIPASGYPKVLVYADEAGTELVAGPHQMYKEDETDFDMMDGSFYSSSFKVNTSGHVYWKVEVVEENDPTLIESTLIRGPLVDAEPPTVMITAPVQTDWITQDRVEVRAIVRDTGGAGIDPATIMVAKALKGLDNIEKGVRMRNVQKIDNDTYEAWATVLLEGGDQNYVVVEVKDHVGNGPSYSEPINIWIDYQGPWFTDVRPRSDVVHLYEDVNCSIVWMDHPPGSQNYASSGVDLSSIEYAYRTTSGPLSDWMTPEGIISLGKGEHRAYINLRFFDDGLYNYIKWRARDNLGQSKETGEIRINVQVPDNYPPSLANSRMYPNSVVSQTPHLFWDAAHDEEGDQVFYSVLLLTYPYKLYLFSSPIQIGRRTFFDVPNSARLEPGYYVLQVNATDKIGGYDIKEWIFRVLDSGTPPPEDIPPVNDIHIPDTQRDIVWQRSPSDGEMDVTYMVRIGTETWMGDVLEWLDVGNEPRYNLTELELNIGHYHVQLMAQNNGNFSRVTETYMKINDYDVVTEALSRYLAYRGRAAIKKAPLSINLTNMATFGDNVTVRVSGEMVDRGWAYFPKSGRSQLTEELTSQKVMTVKAPTRVQLMIYPPSDAEKRTYVLNIEVRSEDGSLQYSGKVNVTLADQPSDNIIKEVANTIYDLLVHLFPFLKAIPKNLLLPLFFIMVALLILAIVAVSTTIYRKEVRKRKRVDPYAEHKRVYKEMYGVEPDQATLERMLSDGDLPGIRDGTEEGKGIETKAFDESFLESERSKAEPPEEGSEFDDAE